MNNPSYQNGQMENNQIKLLIKKKNFQKTNQPMNSPFRQFGQMQVFKLTSWTDQIGQMQVSKMSRPIP